MGSAPVLAMGRWAYTRRLTQQGLTGALIPPGELPGSVPWLCQLQVFSQLLEVTVRPGDKVQMKDTSWDHTGCREVSDRERCLDGGTQNPKSECQCIAPGGGGILMPRAAM